MIRVHSPTIVNDFIAELHSVLINEKEPAKSTLWNAAYAHLAARLHDAKLAHEIQVIVEDIVQSSVTVYALPEAISLNLVRIRKDALFEFEPGVEGHGKSMTVTGDLTGLLEFLVEFPLSNETIRDLKERLASMKSDPLTRYPLTRTSPALAAAASDQELHRFENDEAGVVELWPCSDDQDRFAIRWTMTDGSSAPNSSVCLVAGKNALEFDMPFDDHGFSTIRRTAALSEALYGEAQLAAIHPFARTRTDLEDEC